MGICLLLFTYHTDVLQIIVSKTINNHNIQVIISQNDLKLSIKELQLKHIKPSITSIISLKIGYWLIQKFNVDCKIEKIYVENNDFGTLKISTDHEKIEKISWNSEFAIFNGTGCLQTANLYVTGKGKILNLAQMLAVNKLPAMLAAQNSNFFIDLLFNVNNVQNFSGKLNLTLKSGYIKHKDSNINKLLALLEVSQLKNIATFNFSDLNDGFKFNTLTANLDFLQGNIDQSTINIKSDEAKIALTGSANLHTKQLHFVGEATLNFISDTLTTPLMLSNLGFGAAYILLDKALKPISKIKQKFTISGDFNNPEIKITR